MRLLVVSDLHITGPDDPLYEALLHLLEQRAGRGDVVVLAGDLFELFVGRKEVFLRRYGAFIEAMRRAGEGGVRLHYVEGNHDFFLRRVFSGMRGIRVHSARVSLEIGGKRFYFAHGDLVDRSERRYLALRTLFRSPVMKAFVIAAPDRWIEGIGRASSRRSKLEHPRLIAELPIDRLDRVRRAFRNFAADRLAEGYDFVVLGHCHDLDEMHFNIGGRRGQYVNVGYPRVHGSYLTWTEGEESISREPFGP